MIDRSIGYFRHLLRFEYSIGQLQSYIFEPTIRQEPLTELAFGGTSSAIILHEINDLINILTFEGAFVAVVPFALLSDPSFYSPLLYSYRHYPYNNISGYLLFPLVFPLYPEKTTLVQAENDG